MIWLGLISDAPMILEACNLSSNFNLGQHFFKLKKKHKQTNTNVVLENKNAYLISPPILFQRHDWERESRLVTHHFANVRFSTQNS